MKDLVAFLVARLDEAEERARTCTPGPWRYNPYKAWHLPPVAFGVPQPAEEYVAAGPVAAPVCVAVTGPADDPVSMADAAHIAAYDPVRALMDVAVKRAILTAVTGWRHHVNDEDPWYTCSAATVDADGGETADLSCRGGDCDCGRDARARQILGPLAVPHAAHPDYDPAWGAPWRADGPIPRGGGGRAVLDVRAGYGGVRGAARPTVGARRHSRQVFRLLSVGDHPERRHADR